MSEKLINTTQLAYFWSKIKDWISSQGFLTSHQDISGKQDTISDLSTIRTNATAGANHAASGQNIHSYIKANVTGVAGTSTTQLSTTYNVSDSSITAYEDGMMVCFQLPCAGVSTYGSVFQINSLGYKPIVFNINSIVGTRYGAGASIVMVYNSKQTATAYLTKNTSSTVTGCWQIMDYDANTNTYQRTYRTATDVEVPIAGASTGSTTSAWADPSAGSYKDAYGVVASDASKRATLNPSTGKITFNGDVKMAGTNEINGYTKSSDLATVATSGSYNDLDDKPTIPSAYTHPSYTAHTGNPTANQTPSFGGSFTVSQITNDNQGHVSNLVDRTITIPSTEASTSNAGLMSSSDKTKLDGVATGANKYSHPTYNAQTGKPTANQTPGFGSTFTISQVTSDGTGHVSGMTDRTVKIPNATATTSASGLMSSTDKTNLDALQDKAVRSTDKSVTNIVVSSSAPTNSASNVITIVI